MGGTGRAARSRAGEIPRYGSENSITAGALKITRDVRRKCVEAALASVAHVERLEAQGWAREVGGMGAARYCQCMGVLRIEDVIELSDDDDDDDDDMDILAVTFRQQPMSPKNQPPIDDTADHEVIDGALSTAEDISGHQKNHKIRDFGDDVEEHENFPTQEAQVDKESSMSIDGGPLSYGAALMALVELSEDIKSVLKKLKTKPAALKAKPPVPYVQGNFILRFPAANGNNSRGFVFNRPTPAADDTASS